MAQEIRRYLIAWKSVADALVGKCLQRRKLLPPAGTGASAWDFNEKNLNEVCHRISLNSQCSWWNSSFTTSNKDDKLSWRVCRYELQRDMCMLSSYFYPTETISMLWRVVQWIWYMNPSLSIPISLSIAKQCESEWGVVSSVNCSAVCSVQRAVCSVNCSGVLALQCAVDSVTRLLSRGFRDCLRLTALSPFARPSMYIVQSIHKTLVF